MIKKYFVLILVCMLCGCGQVQQELTKESCRLCGERPYAAMDGIAFLHVNSGTIRLIRLPEDFSERSDREGNYLLQCESQSGVGESKTLTIVDAKENMASASITLGEASLVRQDELKRHYCEKCKEAIAGTSTLDVVLMDCLDNKLYDIGKNACYVIRGYSIDAEKSDEMVRLKITFNPSLSAY